MARTYAMNWEGEPAFRWVRMYKGVRYRVSCAELGATLWTKEATAKLANAWWAKKLAELTPGPSAIERIVAQLTAKDTDALEEDVARGIHAWNVITAQAALEADPPPDLEAVAKCITTEQDADDERTLERLCEVQESLERSHPPTDRTLAHQAARFLSTEELRGKQPGTFGDLSYYVHKMVEGCEPVLAPNMDVAAITAGTVTDLYAWLKKQSGWSPAVQKKVWGYFKRLVRFLWGQSLCELPRNLDQKIFSFDTGPKAIPVYDLKDVRAMLKGLPRRLKLYAFLALNCGMYGVDMAKLKHSEYKNGRIRRKRTKTERTDAPEVDYQLWPETRRLLDSYPSSHPVYVLTSKAGTPLWKAWVEDGKKKKVDLVGLQWHRGRGEGRASKPAIPLKALRSVSATVIESHREYGRYKTHFLGQSPKGIADKHYAAPSRELFDEILAWLRRQILGK